MQLWHIIFLIDTKLSNLYAIYDILRTSLPLHNVYLPNTGSVHWEIQQTVHLHSSQIFINSYSLPHSSTAISHFSLWVHSVSPTLLGSWLHHDTDLISKPHSTQQYVMPTVKGSVHHHFWSMCIWRRDLTIVPSLIHQEVLRPHLQWCTPL